ncbi:hypothetical protein EW093_05365 [Thiospirochaeta perfilievii]|uniref:Uncharacterized protein n=1 Tax=Thiospirochaeta perfilievii TaxID=252967 RepID=A0A5C1QBW9_9SPIO|nr:hypothetical protein [Thiospirochaeta perfilievii]QEN04154.1 hypothetical protein EW093_05365 [Thiospirochaeta perfilievii]
MERLYLIHNFKGGNNDIIQRGMSLLALNMLHGYKKDLVEDSLNGKYNPLYQNEWVYKDEIKKLMSYINSIECLKMDTIMKIEHTAFSFWSYM